MASALEIHHGRGGVGAHPTGAADTAHHRQGRLPAGVRGGRLDHMAERIVLHLLQGVDPAVDQTVMGFPVVVEVVDPDLIVVQPDLVVGIRPHLRHRPPGDGAGRQSLEAEVGDHFAHQGKHWW